MKRRSLRVYAEKYDLQRVFKVLESKLDIYYVPTYSDTGKKFYASVVQMENIGANFYGSHLGNMPMLIFPKSTECLWRTYRCEGRTGRKVTRCSVLEAGNTAWVCVDFNGIYANNTIFPTEINTIYYDDNQAKQLYDELKKIVRKQAVKTVNGMYICPKAYEHREKYRFCTIDIKSPPEYDLKFE